MTMDAVGLHRNPPPVGPKPNLAWSAFKTLRDRPFSMAVWAIFLLALAMLAPALLQWAIIDATWSAENRQGCDPDGACWAFVISRLPQFAFGFFPSQERWRAAIALLAPIIALGLALGPAFRWRTLIVVVVLATYPIFSTLILHGELLGLTLVPTTQWGGMTMTVYVGTVAFVSAFPIGFLLALARTSRLPALYVLATAFIEVWRGLPLIAVLFIAVVMVPLILPPGTEFPRLALALIGITLYTSSYLAEVFRGGLQSIGKGQGEAAAALGFTFWNAQAYILIPQAIRAVLPGILNTVVALFKDTTYVLVVGLFDFLNIVTAAIADPQWLGLATEGYVFVGLVYWSFCFFLTRVGDSLERRLGEGQSRAAGV